MIKKQNRGFTLAEMLIVVAIIGILVAIMSVTISNALEKSREAVDSYNIKSAMSELYQVSIDGDLSGYSGISLKTVGDDKYYQKIVYCTQKIPKWQTGDKEGKITINGALIGASSYSEIIKYWYVRYYVAGTKEGTFAAVVKSNK